jgi:hypothetical protein
MSSVYEPDWVERGEAPFRGRVARIGATAGSERLGAKDRALSSLAKWLRVRSAEPARTSCRT